MNVLPPALAAPPGQDLPGLASAAQFAVLDFECTGSTAGYPDQPWQLGLVLVNGGSLDAAPRFGTLLQVGRRPFNPYAPGRHAQLREALAIAPRLADLWPLLNPWLVGRPLVAHHAATEQRFLEEAFPLHPFGPWIDTLELVRIAYPRLPTHRLDGLVPALGLAPRVEALCPGLAPHDAEYDAVACAALLEHLLALPHWRGVTVDDLAAARSGWARGRRKGATR